jgi:PAS domain S-box-containing protein
MPVLTRVIDQLPHPIMVSACDGTIQYVNRAFELQSGYEREQLIGKPASILKSGHHDAEFFRHLWSTILAGNTFRGVFINRKRDATLFRQVLSISPLVGDLGRIVGFIAIGEDVALARHMRSQYLRMMKAIRAFAVSFPGIVYRENLGRKGGIQLLNKQAASLPAGAATTADALLPAQDRQERQSQIEEAIACCKPFVCEYAIKEATGETRHYLEWGMPMLDFDGMPARVYGVILDATERMFPQEDLRRSEDAMREVSAKILAMQESERKRIARELHDGIGQTLTSIKMQIEAVCATIGQSGFLGTVAELQGIIPAIQDAMQEVRNISKDLRPPILDDIGIIATIAWFTRNFSKTFDGIRVELDLRVSESSVPMPLKTVIYRVIQEGMNNVAKHAGANLVWIRLRNAGAGLELIIEDNGRGFDLPQIASRPFGGVGLASMRERVRMSRGEFWIQSTLQVGTIVRAIWPKENRPATFGDDASSLSVH